MRGSPVPYDHKSTEWALPRLYRFASRKPPHLFGDGEIAWTLFTPRPSELQPNRRQRIRQLARLTNLADAHSVVEFRDPTSDAHNRLIDIVRRLARRQR